MVDGREAASGHFPGASSDTAPEGVVSAGPERILLLEFRLEQLRAALDEAREEADRARTRLAEAAAREADQARRHGLIHEELAEARAEAMDLHRRLERSEALRAEIEGHFFESGATGDAEELTRLRTRSLVDHERALVSERALARLRARVQELLSSRETLITRMAEWQRLVREESPEAADLAEFIADLRREILDLEQRTLEGESREAALRERLVLAESPTAWLAERVVLVPPSEAPAADAADVIHGDAAGAARAQGAGIAPDAGEGDAAVAAEAEGAGVAQRAAAAEDDAVVAAEAEATEVAAEVPPAAGDAVAAEGQAAGATAEDSAPPVAPRAQAETEPRPPRSRTDAWIAELAEAPGATLRAELLVRLGRSGDLRVVDAVLPWTGSAEPSVRAAAYEALGRLLERDATALGPHLRTGLADADARVRRRVVLAAATARGVQLRSLLEPLREDPDGQVRRVVREVLRRAPAQTDAPAGEANGEGEGGHDPVRLKAASGGAT